jgi:hypothetical protein
MVTKPKLESGTLRASHSRGLGRTVCNGCNEDHGRSHVMEKPIATLLAIGKSYEGKAGSAHHCANGEIKVGAMSGYCYIGSCTIDSVACELLDRWSGVIGMENTPLRLRALFLFENSMMCVALLFVCMCVCVYAWRCERALKC